MPGSRRILWCVAVAALVVFGYILGCTTPPTGAAGTAREEYKILNYQGKEEATELQSLLNETAKEGWKVRAHVGGRYYIIMAR